MRAAHRALGRGQLGKQPFHLRVIEPHVDLDGGAAGDAGGHRTAQTFHRYFAQLAFRDLQDLEYQFLDVAWTDAGRSPLYCNRPLSERLGIKAGLFEFSTGNAFRSFRWLHLRGKITIYSEFASLGDERPAFCRSRRRAGLRVSNS